ncbi:scarecrow-like protein 14 [Miscanthus floridulus]|uniref:scarecrow-like protein 14 n=1 Tax=Miscanthus floridulus TaxID=154761 RepID=UPI0034593409
MRMTAPRVFPGFTPASRVDADAASSSSYLSRISLLMEEEEEDDLADHPALLHAQQPFAQILSGGPFLPDQGPVFPGGSPEDKEYGTDMFTAAFFKGVEEASKFLPAYTAATLLSNDTSGGGGKGRRDRHTVGGDDELEADASRTSNLAMAESEEAGAREMFDEMMLRGFDVCSKEMEGLAISVENVPAKDDGKKKARKRSRARGKRRPARVVDVHTLLIHCAKAVIDDRRSADELLSQIKEHASPTGDATQRLAYCFAQGLEARLAGTGSQVYRSLTTDRTSLVEFLKAYQLFMSTCCFRKVAFMFANKTIFDAAVGRSKLHIVDYGLHSGFQWPELLRLLGTRDGGPPQVRVTSIDLPQPGFRPANHMAEMGYRLTNCARELCVPLSFRSVVAPWHTVCIDDLNVEPDEVLVVNDLFNFRTLMDESIISDSPSPRDVVLSNIRKMKPDIFIQAIVNGFYGTTFLSRFREALFYHSALFDMLDATMPRESQLRLVLERDIFGWVALNAIACEGEDRVERGETYKQWEVRNQRAGLRQLPLNGETVKMVRDMVKNQYHKDFVIEEGQQWLLQGWKGRILFAHSMWAADGASSDC